MGSTKRLVPGLGEEITNYKFNGVLDWLITINDPRERWKAQPTYLISEWVYVTVGLLTFLHSRRVGGRFKWIWLASVLHGFVIENVTYWTEDINNFWHSQTTIMLFGRRLPFHILLVYPAFIYTSSVLVSRLRLKLIPSAMAIGLCAVLIDIPYDIMAIKFMHWTWHDTDPNIADRHYWVPWTSYYFHATFAFSFFLAFYGWRRLLCQNDPSNPWVEDRRWNRELLCSVLTGLTGMLGGTLLFVPIYHPLHDLLGIHTENCVLTLVVIFVLVVWKNDRDPTVGARPADKQGRFYVDEIVVGLVLHYSVYLGMACFGVPEYEISVGLHEKIGPCNDTVELHNIFTLFTGETVKRRKYLCVEDYDEQYFDFRCVDNKAPKQGSEWYTICGTPYANQAEYIQVILLICFAAFMIFRTMLYGSGPDWEAKQSSSNKKTT